ncbi:MAG: acyl-CoA dehydrogenase family protein [Acidimicrobiia bacterium]
MDLRYSDSDEAFRARLRDWLAAELPKLPNAPHREDWPARRAYDTDWQRRLFDAGYAGLNWPKEYGGQGASPTEQLIFLEETTRARAPYVGVNFVGQMHAGPTLIAEGTDEQKREHLPKILRGDEVWCQGFSEPSAGSDLASLRTRAVRDGDHYVVTGRKIWCSFAQVGDIGELLVRTDPDAPKHKGITWLMLPMHLPGIEIRPLKTALGSSEFAEVFLDEVRVPVACRVGAENDGWRVTNVTLSFERGTAFVGEMVDAMRLVEDLSPYATDPAHRRELGHLAAELDALWALTKRNITQAGATGATGRGAMGRGAMGRGAMMIKLPYTELRQRLGELSLRVLDRASLSIEDFAGLHNGVFVEERLRTLALTIAAGTSQIQRNIIGERVLGLPKEPK